jgi:hypothetical protein
VTSINAQQKRRAPYTGNSKRTKYRKYGPSGQFTKAARSTFSITDFFKPLNAQPQTSALNLMDLDKISIENVNKLKNRNGREEDSDNIEMNKDTDELEDKSNVEGKDDMGV